MNKIILVFFACLVVCGSARAQAPARKDSLYIITYTTGPSWDQSKGPNEQPYFKEHSSRLSQLRKDGVIKFGARYADKGIIVITAATLVAAKEVVLQDQAVTSKLFSADVQKLSIFYEGCLERVK